MIRPITVFCWILALGAGLYLYRAKHEVELMDQHIDQIAKQTAELRTESRGLLDEWIRLGEPEQLHKYSDTYLGLKTIAPSQFARVTDLANRLVPPQADPPAVSPDMATGSSDEPPNGTVTTDIEVATEAGGEDLPVPPIPPAVPPPVNAVTLQAVTAPPLQARPVTPRPAASSAEQDPARTRVGSPPRVADESRPAETRSTAAAQAETRPVAPPSRGLPPLQAQRPGNVQGLPPLQAQGSGPGPAQAAVGVQAAGSPVARAAEPRVAENNAVNDPRRDVRPTLPQSPPPQMMEPRGLAATVPRPGPPPAQPPPGGSLLGMSRGTVPLPLPLPAPTPVSATWQGPAGGGPVGPGR